jgi:Protein of unknown function (DUF3467)
MTDCKGLLVDLVRCSRKVIKLDDAGHAGGFHEVDISDVFTVTPNTKGAPTTGGGNSIKVNTESEKASYANFVKLDSTQEEVVISFGLDKTWDGSKGQREIDIGHRIVLSPFAAKRLAQMMEEFVQSYEKKYGALAMK